MQIKTATIFVAGPLSFSIEKSWVPGKTYDVVIWETDQSPLHNHVVGTTTDYATTIQYARGLVEDMQFFLLTQIRDQRERALAACAEVTA